MEPVHVSLVEIMVLKMKRKNNGQVPPPLEADSLYMEPVHVSLEGSMVFGWRGCSLSFTSTPQVSCYLRITSLVPKY